MDNKSGGRSIFHCVYIRSIHSLVCSFPPVCSPQLKYSDLSKNCDRGPSFTTSSGPSFNNPRWFIQIVFRFMCAGFYVALFVALGTYMLCKYVQENKQSFVLLNVTSGQIRRYGSCHCPFISFFKATTITRRLGSFVLHFHLILVRLRFVSCNIPF